MGRSASHAKHLATLQWAQAYRVTSKALPDRLSIPALRGAHSNDLWRYVSLCWLARSNTAPVPLAAEAHLQVFRVRAALEANSARST
jgi:hypothetical protein